MRFDLLTPATRPLRFQTSKYSGTKPTASMIAAITPKIRSGHVIPLRYGIYQIVSVTQSGDMGWETDVPAK